MLPQTIQDNPYLSIISIVTIIVGGIVIYNKNNYYYYIKCKVIIKKEDATEAIFYNCVRWNQKKRNGFVYNKITHQTLHLKKRDRIIIANARSENKTPEIRL